MPRIKYVGPFDAVEVSGVGNVKNGESADVSDTLAKSLLEQSDNWAAEKKPATTKSEGA